MRVDVGPPTRKPTSSSMSRARVGVEARVAVARVGHQTGRPLDVGAADHHRARPAVVADGEVAPVGQQRLGVRAQDPPQVRGVVDRGVEVDVVAHLHRQQHVDVTDRVQQVEAVGSAEQLADAVAQGAATSARHQGVERRSRRQVELDAGGDEVDDVVADAHADPWLLVARAEHAERQVLDGKVRSLRHRRPGHGPIMRCSERRRPKSPPRSATWSLRVSHGDLVTVVFDCRGLVTGPWVGNDGSGSVRVDLVTHILDIENVGDQSVGRDRRVRPC